MKIKIATDEDYRFIIERDLHVNKSLVRSMFIIRY